MKFYKINREERHFSFLFMAAVISNHSFRKRSFESINQQSSLTLNPNDFDVYAEVALFRDYWYSLGDHKNYDMELHNKRMRMLQLILKGMNLDEQLICDFDMFWTGEIGQSKLWYPGRWATSKIREIEKVKNITEKKLWRCRWLCNAKPDVLIQSPDNLLFIEIKVESGMGSADTGYDQEQTQQDIITIGSKIFDWMHISNIDRITLTKKSEKNNLSWEDVKIYLDESKIANDPGFAMIKKHLSNMPI